MHKLFNRIAHDCHAKRICWLYFILCVLSLKLIIYCVDPLPMFYLGDSWSYLSTALHGTIPLDRSFVYGFLIRLTAVASHSLSTLTLVQVLSSALNAILVSFILQRFFFSSAPLSFLMGLLCAIEPLQLMYERYVMTETVSLTLFVLYLLIAFYYLKKPILKLLILFQLVGTLLISLRLSFLPLVIVNTFLIPMLALPAFLKEDARGYTRKFPRKILSHLNPFGKTFALHLLVSIVLVFCLHQGYRYLNGSLSQNPPAYQYQGGIFLFSYLAPIVEPEDFPYAELRNDVFGNLKYDWRDRHKRADHHWRSGGLVVRLHEAVPDVLEADRAARETVVNALRRNPLGIFRLLFMNFSDYWDRDWLYGSMQSDRGDRPLPDFMLETLEASFNLVGDDLPFIHTFTNRYFMHAWPWFQFLLFSPLFALAALFLCWREYRRLVFVLFVTSAITIAMACTLVEGPTVRYLHAQSWTIFLIMACFIHCGMKKIRRLQG